MRFPAGGKGGEKVNATGVNHAAIVSSFHASMAVMILTESIFWF